MQVTQDFATFHDLGVDLVFLCEFDKAHHGRATLPSGWQTTGEDEFLLAMAPGWTFQNATLRRVWPTVPAHDRKKGWRLYYQAGGSSSSSPTPTHPTPLYPNPAHPSPTPCA